MTKFLHDYHSHKNNERFFKEKRKASFFIFMAMLSLRQVESNYSKKEPCIQGCSWIIKFSPSLHFSYGKHGTIIFSIRTRNGGTQSTRKEKICEVSNFRYVFKKEFLCFFKKTYFPF